MPNAGDGLHGSTIRSNLATSEYKPTPRMCGLKGIVKNELMTKVSDTSGDEASLTHALCQTKGKALKLISNRITQLHLKAVIAVTRDE